jgi:Uma2 family endonuclease
MHAAVRLSPEALARRWRELAKDPQSPDFYELDEFGELVVSPNPTNRHERIAFKVASALETQLGVEATTAISILTDIGIRRPDATWMPESRWQAAGEVDPLPFAPDICVEVLSPTNTLAEVQIKVGAYLRAGAREVIVVGLDGAVKFCGPEGERETSAFGVRFNWPVGLF